MIEARHLTKTFRDKRRGEIRAADDISFHVSPGQIYGLLGANGAGKTTTLRLLATLLKPTGGSATVAGFDVARDSLEVRRRIGYLPENCPLYPEMRVDEYLRYYTTYGVQQVLNLNPGTVLAGYLLHRLGVDIEFKISVFMGNDNPFAGLWTLLGAKLFAREDGTTPLVGLPRWIEDPLIPSRD